MFQPILIVGPIGAGKTTLAGYLKTKGWKVISVSNILRGLYRKANGSVPTRSQLQEVGADIIAEYGEDYLAELIASESLGNAQTVIEGVRTIAIALALKNIIPQLFIIYVSAPQVIRLQRMMFRDDISCEEFYDFESIPIEFQVVEIKRISNYEIENSGPIGLAISRLNQLLIFD